MKQKEVKVGGIYLTKIGESLVRVKVIHEEVPGTSSWSFNKKTRYAVARLLSSDGTVGPVLPKRRTAAALRQLSIEIQIYEAQRREDARAEEAGEKPQLITTLADIPTPAGTAAALRHLSRDERNA